MKMPIGKFKGQPIEAMTTQYLAWLVTQDNIRFKYWAMTKEALRVLRDRFERMDELLAEIEVATPPVDRRPTPEQKEQRKATKAAKLRELEARRAEERKKRREERRAQYAQARIQAEAAYLREKQEAWAARQWDASYYVRDARKKQADPNDISDLL